MYDLHLELNRIGKNSRSISISTRSSVFVVFVVLLDSIIVALVVEAVVSVKMYASNSAKQGWEDKGASLSLVKEQFLI